VSDIEVLIVMIAATVVLGGYLWLVERVRS
jgi:hypothetical protein